MVATTFSADTPDLVTDIVRRQGVAENWVWWAFALTGIATVFFYARLWRRSGVMPDLDPSLLGDDIAYPAMLKFLPVGFAGLMIGGLIAAYSSTILTPLNWSASYLVHDFYRRFLKPDATEKQAVFAGRLVTVGLFVCASALTFVLETAKDIFDIILQIGAGTGLLYLVRWFWWRVTAWCEIVAMAVSFLVSIGLFVAKKNGLARGTHEALPSAAPC